MILSPRRPSQGDAVPPRCLSPPPAPPDLLQARQGEPTSIFSWGRTLTTVKDTILGKSKVSISKQGTWEGAGVPESWGEHLALRFGHTITTMLGGGWPGCPSSQGTSASQGSEVSQLLDGSLCLSLWFLGKPSRSSGG